jgi:hypothetical protein
MDFEPDDFAGSFVGAPQCDAWEATMFMPRPLGAVGSACRGVGGWGLSSPTSTRIPVDPTVALSRMPPTPCRTALVTSSLVSRTAVSHRARSRPCAAQRSPTIRLACLTAGGSAGSVCCTVWFTPGLCPTA